MIKSIFTRKPESNNNGGNAMNNSNNFKSQFNVPMLVLIASRQGTSVRTMITDMNVKGVIRNKVETNFSDEVCGLNFIAVSIQQFVSLNKETLTVIADRNVIMRCWQMRKVLKANPSYSPEQLQNAVVRDWMNKDLVDTLGILAESMISSKDKWINFVVRRTLTEFMLDADECFQHQVQDGDVLDFEDSVDKKFGIHCTDNSFLNGKHTVKVVTTKDREGNEYINYYVARSGNNHYLNIARKMNEATIELLPKVAEDVELEIIDNDLAM